MASEPVTVDEPLEGGLAFKERPKRWGVPFSPDMRPEAVAELLARAPFSTIDAAKFPARLPLEGILLNDCRIVSCENGGIVVRQGDYGHSAFLILEGAVRVILGELPDDLLGRRGKIREGIWRRLARAFRPPVYPEVRRRSSSGAERPMTRGASSGAGMFLQDVPGVLDKHKTVQLRQGEIFGELAALSRTPRTSTIIADGPCRLLEIRWQGLRDIRRHAPEWKEQIDRLYRERSLLAHLRETPVLRHLGEEQLQVVAAQTRFDTHGNFDWNASSPGADASHAERLAREPIISREGEYTNGLLMIRGGFARLSQRYNHSERTVSYLGKGGCYGLAEIVHNWRNPGATIALGQSLRAVGYVDTLFIPTALVEQLILPSLPEAELAALLPPAPVPVSTSASANRLDTDMLEFLVGNRYINGTASMLIDLARCTRCDDCVRACAAGHDNNPRFIRQGAVHDGIMITHACMHCVDPVCMIGCPTGAIHRDSAHGEVVINHETCIGCSTCANSCPYGNIQMVAIRDDSGRPLFDPTSQTPIVQATKCDLCIDDHAGPACVRACPHDALTRADMTDVSSLASWLNRE